MQKRRKKHEIKYTKSATRDLVKLEQKESKRIRNKIKFFAVQEDPLVFSEHLTGLRNKHRWRVGDYRIIFRKDPRTNKIMILWILAVKKRDKVYKKLK